MLKVDSKKKTRLFATVIYPESAPPDFINLIDYFHVPAFLSPLHDSDVDNGSGEKKKEHYHLLLMFDGPKTLSQVEPLFNSIHSVGVEFVQSLRGYSRYLCHLDNPEKFQYDIQNVRSFCGADYESVIGTSYDKKTVVREIMHFIDSSNVTTYSQLLRYCSYYKADWFSFLLDSSYVIKEYLLGIREEYSASIDFYSENSVEVPDRFKK